MKKNGSTPEHKHNSPNHHIPDVEVIDLEVNGTEAEEDYREEETEYPRKGIYKFFNIHVIFIALLVLFVGIIYFRIKNWGVMVDLDEIFKDGPGTYEDHLDSVLPLLDADRNMIHGKDPATIVAFGNAPFADDRDSKDNLANLIAEKTGATVYNCSIGDSYLAAGNSELDVFSFYWLAHLAIGSSTEHYYTDAKATLGADYPEEADEVIAMLTTIDFNNVDVITVMYDATDYLLGHGMYTDGLTTDIDTFTGNLEAGIELIQDTYPHIRIIVMSPTYAYAVDKDGNYISSDQFVYNNQDVLSTYVIKQCASCAFRSVSFMDNLYNTITEDNAKEYLVDNLHLNVAGRRLIADRFEYFLNYYKKGYAETD